MIAKRVQGKMAALGIRHDFSSVANHITLSIGIATTIPSDSQSRNGLIQQADDFLYKAKTNGRNQFTNGLNIS